LINGSDVRKTVRPIEDDAEGEAGKATGRSTGEAEAADERLDLDDALAYVDVGSLYAGMGGNLIFDSRLVMRLAQGSLPPEEVEKGLLLHYINFYHNNTRPN